MGHPTSNAHVQGLRRVPVAAVATLVKASGKGEAGVPRWWVEPLRWEAPLEGAACARPIVEYARRTSDEEPWDLYAARVQEAAGELGIQLGDQKPLRTLDGIAKICYGPS